MKEFNDTTGHKVKIPDHYAVHLKLTQCCEFTIPQ